jgi:hypothetical protein
MNTRLLFLSIFFISLLASLNILNAQTIATGHISAEVVEAVSASSHISTDFSIRHSSFNNTDIQHNRLDLGSVEISSGVDVACNLTIKPAALTDASGNAFTVEPVASYAGMPQSTRIDGSQMIDLAVNAQALSNQASGLYQGSYTLVFAYN